MTHQTLNPIYKPTLEMIQRFSDRWSLRALLVLHKPTRFNQLRRELNGVSQKMLSQTLKGLERDGLIKREVFATVPVTVEYSITDLGTRLIQSIDSVRDWADIHFDAIQEARQRFDASEQAAPPRLLRIAM